MKQPSGRLPGTLLGATLLVTGSNVPAADADAVMPIILQLLFAPASNTPEDPETPEEPEEPETPTVTKVPGKPDFNGDGYADLAIGEYGAPVGTVTQAGQVRLIYGTETGLHSRSSQVLNRSGLFDERGRSQGDVQFLPQSSDLFGRTIASGDFNNDGFVTDADYTIWADHYSPYTGAVPEPASALILLLAAGAAGAARRQTRE